MNERIAAVITVTALEWNVPGLAPGFCWRKYGARKSTQPEGSSRAPRRVVPDRLAAATRIRVPPSKLPQMADMAVQA